jgi:hypothetical protein
MKEYNSKIYFSKGHLNNEGIALYVDALAIHKEEMLPVDIHEHMQDCYECKKEAFALYAVMQKDNVIQNTFKHPYLDKLPDNARKQVVLYAFLKIAAGLILVLSLGILIYYIVYSSQGHHSSNNTMHNFANTSKAVELHPNSKAKGDVNLKEDSVNLSNSALASTMKEFSLYENLITAQYRNDEIQIDFPPLNYSFHSQQDVMFKLKGDISVPVVLIIFNNRGKKLMEISGISKREVTVTQKLPFGLYYWKLLMNDDLIQTGKFFVK